MSGLCQLYVSCMSVVCQLYVRLMSGVCLQVYVVQLYSCTDVISFVCNVSCISCVCQAYVWCVSAGICRTVVVVQV